jgi:hypothetical protein
VFASVFPRCGTGYSNRFLDFLLGCLYNTGGGLWGVALAALGFGDFPRVFRCFPALRRDLPQKCAGTNNCTTWYIIIFLLFSNLFRKKHLGGQNAKNEIYIVGILNPFKYLFNMFSKGATYAKAVSKNPGSSNAKRYEAECPVCDWKGTIIETMRKDEGDDRCPKCNNTDLIYLL